MVISFTDDTAFEYLDEYGYVVTFRESRRKRPNCETWCNRGRGLPKEFDVRVSEICRADPGGVDTDLSTFATASGFGDAVSWRAAIRQLNDGDTGEGWLYLVTKEDGDGE